MTPQRSTMKAPVFVPESTKGKEDSFAAGRSHILQSLFCRINYIGNFASAVSKESREQRERGGWGATFNHRQKAAFLRASLCVSREEVCPPSRGNWLIWNDQKVVQSFRDSLFRGSLDDFSSGGRNCFPSIGGSRHFTWLTCWFWSLTCGQCRNCLV